MKLFEEQEPIERPEPQPIRVDSTDFIKRNLLRTVERSPEVYKAIEDWLYSFGGGISKIAFQHQMKRVDFNDTVALAQLQKAKGRRVIPLPPPPKPPKLDRPLVEQMVEQTYIAVTGRKFKDAIHQAVKELKECGKVYVLSIEELILEFKTYQDKGKSPQMISDAISADFLFVVDLEMPIHLEWHIREAIERVGRMREAKNLPIISTWNRFNDCNEFFKRFHVYTI